ncbi:MAG TPA: hypothetical protein VNN79_01445, partial [Actinomycetota bacterium]|nr:hypothetical protein [Actinomycetota bacterium]
MAEPVTGLVVDEPRLGAIRKLVRSPVGRCVGARLKEAEVRRDLAISDHLGVHRPEPLTAAGAAF